MLCRYWMVLLMSVLTFPTSVCIVAVLPSIKVIVPFMDAKLVLMVPRSVPMVATFPFTSISVALTSLSLAMMLPLAVLISRLRLPLESLIRPAIVAFSVSNFTSMAPALLSILAKIPSDALVTMPTMWASISVRRVVIVPIAVLIVASISPLVPALKLVRVAFISLSLAKMLPLAVLMRTLRLPSTSLMRPVTVAFS